MLYLLGIAIDFFLVIILATKKNKSEADHILGAWLFFIGLHLMFFYLFLTRQFIEFPYLLGTGMPFPLIHGPFLFLYTSSLTNQVHNRNLRYLHFLPFVMAYIPLMPFLLSSAEHKISTYEHHGAGYEWLLIPMNLAVIISGVVYVALSLIKLYRHRKNIENQFSNIDKINLDWLRYLIFGMGVIWLVVIFGTDTYIYGTVVIYVFFIGYFGIKQTTIFSHSTPLLVSEDAPPDLPEAKGERTNVSGPDPEMNTEKGKYLKSGLSEEEQQQIHDKLTRLMEQKKLFVNPELTLGEMAQQLDVHPNYLSQVINSVAKKNFYDFINSWRVEEFNRAVRQPENQKFTLLSLAYECGFNSKTSFNRNFRKITGFSPSEYLKQNNVSLSQ